MPKKNLKIQGRLIDSQILFKTAQVLEIFEIKAGRFREWTDKKYITPNIKASNKGAHHYFTKEGLYRIGLYKKFSDFGLNRWIASQFSKEISLERWADISSWYKEKSDGNVYLFIHGKIGTKKDKNWRENLNVEIVDWEEPAIPDDIDGAIYFNLTRIVRTIDELVE